MQATFDTNEAISSFAPDVVDPALVFDELELGFEAEVVLELLRLLLLEAEAVLELLRLLLVDELLVVLYDELLAVDGFVLFLFELGLFDRCWLSSTSSTFLLLRLGCSPHTADLCRPRV